MDAGLFAVRLFSKVWNETVDEESNWNFSCAGGFLESSWYHAGIRSSWLCFITNQGSDYLVIISPPASLIAWVNTASACKLWVWPSTFATRDENPGVPGCAAPPSALPVSLGWCRRGWAGLAVPTAVREPSASSWMSCSWLRRAGTTFHSQKATWGEGGCCRAPAVLHNCTFCDIWPETAAFSF